MFVPCIIRRSRNNQHYAVIFTTPLFYILAPTCFGSSLPSSGSFLDQSELLEIQIEWVVYLKYITEKELVCKTPCVESNRLNYVITTGCNTLWFRMLQFTFLPPWTFLLYYTFVPYFSSLYIPLLLRHSICFIIQKVFHTLILYLLNVLDIPPIRSAFQVTQTGQRSSLMMEGYCRNM
jgi:hypothetical protein